MARSRSRAGALTMGVALTLLFRQALSQGQQPDQQQLEELLTSRCRLAASQLARCNPSLALNDLQSSCCRPFDALREIGCGCDTGMRAVLEGILEGGDVQSALRQCPGKAEGGLTIPCSTSAYPEGWNIDADAASAADAGEELLVVNWINDDDLESLEHGDGDEVDMSDAYYTEYDGTDFEVSEATSRYSGEYEVREGQEVLGLDPDYMMGGVADTLAAVESLVRMDAFGAPLFGGGDIVDDKDSGDMTVDVFVDVTPSVVTVDAEGNVVEPADASSSDVDITYEISGSGPTFYNSLSSIVSWIAAMGPAMQSASADLDRMDRNDDVIDRVSALVSEITSSLGAILGSSAQPLDVDIEYEIDIEDSALRGSLGDIEISIDPVATDGTVLTLAQQIEAMKGALAAAQPLLSANPDTDWDKTLDIPVPADPAPVDLSSLRLNPATLAALVGFPSAGTVTGSEASPADAGLATQDGMQPAQPVPECWRSRVRAWLCAHRDAVKLALGLEVAALAALVVGSLIYGSVRSRRAAQLSVEQEALAAPLLIEDASEYAKHPQGAIVSPLWSHMMNHKDTQTL